MVGSNCCADPFLIVTVTLATDGVLAGCVRHGRAHGHLVPVLVDVGLAERRRTRLSRGWALLGRSPNRRLRDDLGIPDPAEAMICMWGAAVLNARIGIARQPRRSGGRHIRTHAPIQKLVG